MAGVSNSDSIHEKEIKMAEKDNKHHTMEEYLLYVKATSPILLAFWLVLWYLSDFMQATFCIVAAVVLAIIVVAWVDFVCKGNHKKTS
jgi:hypothetical protein